MQTIDFNQWNAKETLKQVALNDGLSKGVVVKDCRLSHCLLADKHLKEVSFQGGSIMHSRFESSKLTDATFERVDLTGSVFVNCDLRNASFRLCKLWYVRFENCELDYAAVLVSAPEETNLRQEFLRHLRVNAMRTGDKTWADQLLTMELRTQEHELFNIVVGNADYYRNKYSGVARIRTALRLALLLLNRAWWGYGLRLSNLATSGTIVVTLFALMCRLTPARYAIDGRADLVQLTWPESFYYSVISFTTGGFGDIRPANTPARIVTSIEGLVGVLFLGFFAAAMYRRLAK